MRRYLTLIGVLLFFTSLLWQPAITFAQSPQSAKVDVSANVGQYRLTLSGIQSPFASIVLIVNDYVLGSTTADTNGRFTLPTILVVKGFTSFCLQAIDVKRLGESYTCMAIPPVTQDTVKNDIFLPPTVGLEKKQVTEGSNALVWGYTMRNAIGTIHLSDGRTFAIHADGEGFYQLKIPISKAGTYELFADATYQGQKSLIPTRTVRLTAIALLKELAQQVGKILTNPLLVGLALLVGLILLIILLRKLFPELWTTIEYGWEEFAIRIPFLRRKLHHWWFMGY